MDGGDGEEAGVDEAVGWVAGEEPKGAWEGAGCRHCGCGLMMGERERALS